MKLQIEDYLGDDVISLDYYAYIISNSMVLKIEEISIPHGFSIADRDEDEDGNEYIRIQQIENGPINKSIKELFNTTSSIVK